MCSSFTTTTTTTPRRIWTAQKEQAEVRAKLLLRLKEVPDELKDLYKNSFVINIYVHQRKGIRGRWTYEYQVTKDKCLKVSVNKADILEIAFNEVNS